MMTPPSVEFATRAGARENEDVVRVLPNAVALLDGATSVRPTARTGGWYAHRLADSLGQRLGSNADLADIAAEAIQEVAETHGLRPGDSPSSTLALLRWDHELVDALVLADSPIVLFTTAGAEPVTDDRLAELRTGSRGYRERLRHGGGFDHHHYRELAASMDRTRGWRNTEGGFWVAEAVPEAAHRAVRAQRPRTDISTALLASDGVACGITDYGHYPDWTALLAEAEASGPRRVLDAIRSVEESDPDGRRWPRPKRHDDQTLAIVRFPGYDTRV